MKVKLHTSYNDLPFILDNDIDVIYENTEQSLEFNVMPNKYISEKLFIEKYTVSKKKIKAYFNREYKSEMIKSPDHYIFLSALINLQKLIYVIMCKQFGVKYEQFGAEKCKIWPIKTETQINGLLRNKKNIIQDFEIQSFDKLADNKYLLQGVSTSESAIIIKGSAIIYKL